MAGVHTKPLLAVFLTAIVTAILLMSAGAGVAHAACKGAHATPLELKKKRAEKAILCLINRQRAKRGLDKLKKDRKQRKAAKKHSRRMVKKRCFSHRCKGEPDLAKRIKRAGYLPCNCYWGVGENLAYGENYLGSPKRIVRAWMKSPAHRDNVLQRKFEHIGIGVVWGSPEGRNRDAATYTTNYGYKD
ncbi:MAG TPA: CAP domain-containing protein [Solirubrobacterales bacterium]|nr:CAP domain-containing protein [Solirubrobacterales bacterium]